ncbi:heterokaryon incompatibility protein-domain-containing protein [Dactylonectria estremocensis]|uniref:Heterokaryon incompatibility protein-domain-containing protein n=1 Tax=Dactylonectria estremocensis TaxID=1079267 RepID=A0A9P9IMW2_9HYPO|nr:heterokaryon incompatibility protein-domain-containing protein [Dactylonectria estremocensis]
MSSPKCKNYLTSFNLSDQVQTMSQPTTPLRGSLYSTLRLTQHRDIRLLKVVPENRGVVECNIEVVNLDDSPGYTAISYTWGPSTNEEAARGISSQPSRPISCNSHTILVTESLYNLLLRVRDYGIPASRHLWIDALCIDQDNPLERTSQVTMMANIYHSASTVLVWLGEEDEDAGRSFRLIGILGKHCRDCLALITPQKLTQRDEEVTELLGREFDVSYWNSLAKFWQRRYFTRAWIVQEISLARKAIAICGSHVVDWECVINVSRFLTVTSWTRWVSARLGIGTPATHLFNYMVPTIVNANKRARDMGDKNIMLYSLIRGRRFTASDPRDKVYAFLGVAGDSVKGKPRFAPIYGERSVVDTYTSAAIQLLEDSDDMLLLTCSEGEQFQKISPLPSWVPDWSCSRGLGLGITGYKRYSAAGSLLRSLSIDEASLTLTVKGFKVDDIIAKGASKSEIISETDIMNWLCIVQAMPQVYHTGQSRSEVFWRTLITDTGGTPPCHPAPAAFGQGFVLWLTSQYRKVIDEKKNGQTSQLMDEVISTVTGSSSFLQEAHHKQDADDYETTLYHAGHLRPFLTRKNYIGVGSESLTGGNSVWIVCGSPVPLILREADPGTFRILGGSYLHGFMKGEALEENIQFQNVKII